MTNFNNSPELDNLNAGRDFADYLIMNGWEITEIFTGGNLCQTITFKKDNVRIEYFINDQYSRFQTKFTILNYKGWHEKDYIKGPNLEDDVTKFSFLCHALGWVDMKEANRNCKESDNGNLFELLENEAYETVTA